MTVAQAYRLIGARADIDSVELERIYRARLQKVQRLLVPGHPVAIRQQAQQQVAELAEAWEVLKKHVVRCCPPPGRRNYSGARTLPPRRLVEMGAGFLIVAAIICVITSLCFTHAPEDKARIHKSVSVDLEREISSPKPKLVAGHTAAPARVEKPMVRMRVLSVPWCYVEVDGKSLGPSGQAEAFEVREGPHKLRLFRGNKVLTKTIELTKGSHVVVKAQFDKDRIDVSE